MEHSSEETLTRAADRLGGWLGWALPPAIVAMQLLDLRKGFDGRPSVISLFLVGFALLAALTMPYWRRLSRVGRAGQLCLVAFSLLLLWALSSAVFGPQPRLWTPRLVVAREFQVVPVLTAIVTMLAAWGLALALPERRRGQVLWWGAATLAFSTLLAGPRTSIAKGTIRLGTGMGGAATFHVALLVALGVLLGAALAGRRPRWSGAGAALCVVGILLTASRAGLACLALFGLCIGPLLVGRRQLRAFALAASLALGCMVLFVLALPGGRHVLQAQDDGRATNLQLGWRAVSADPQSLLFGRGSGRVWPWYVFDAGAARPHGPGLMRTPFGWSVTNPHSLPLGVLVELGLLGALLLAVFALTIVATVGRRWWSIRALRGQGTPTEALHRLASLMPALGVACALPAFALDHYLLKNFAVSFWWWLALVLAVWLPAHGEAQRPRVANS